MAPSFILAKAHPNKFKREERGGGGGERGRESGCGCAHVKPCGFQGNNYEKLVQLAIKLQHDRSEKLKITNLKPKQSIHPN